MSNDKFKLRYEIEDGYVGGSRPQYVDIYAEDFEDDMDEEDIREMIEDLAHEDMIERVSATVNNLGEAVAWVSEILNREGES